MDIAGVTVCVPSHSGRGDRLVRLLDSLQPARRAVPLPTEVIVVDDSPAGEFARVRRHCATLGVSHLRGPRPAGAKRNLGARHAAFDVLLFVDSDCVATQGLVTQHVAALSAAPADVAGVVGRVVTPHGRSPTALRRIYRECSDFPLRYREVGWGPTGNLCVRREVFDRLGGFDESTFTPVGGEDVDLGVRAREAGYRWLASPWPTVLHPADPSAGLLQELAKQLTYGRADVFLTSRHPARRAWHANPVAAGVLALLSAASVAVAGAAPPLPAAVAALPALAGVGAALRSGWGAGTSLRHRLLGALLDVAFDAGTVVEALRRARPLLAWRRFRYAGGPGFRPRGAAAEPHRPAGSPPCSP